MRNFCVLFGALAFAHPLNAQPPSLTLADARVLSIARAAHLSGEIVLSDPQGAIFDRTLGFENREQRSPHRAGERWLWASVTKQVTAVLVMQQVEAGALSLDATLRSYLPEFPSANGDRVTVRMLLQHLSGLPNPEDSTPDADGIPRFYRETGKGIRNLDRSRGFCSGTPKGEDETGFSYNNCDYLVLGAILERVSGQSYSTLVSRRIAGPLGLRSVRVAPDAKERGGSLAIGYTAEGKPHPSINVATFGAAGALTGTAADLITFDRALIAGKLVSPESRARLWEGDPRLGYEGLGVWSFSAQLDGCSTPVALIERRGDIAGIQVRNVIAPMLGRSLAIFINDGSVDFGEVWQGKGLTYELLSAAFCPPVNR